MTRTPRQPSASPRLTRPGRATARLRHRFAPGLLLVLCVGALVSSTPSLAQDWSDDDDWGTTSAGSTYTNTYNDTYQDTAWYLRGGIGFTVDPDEFLLNFELAHQFDRYISLGPMLQIGVADNRSIWAPTMNLTLTIPDMPGDALDQFHPFLFAGAGVGVLENKDRGGRPDTRQTGFLVNTGFGIDYALDEQFSVGSRMIFNILPGRTLNEDWFYSWEIIGFKMAF